jgi:hypothetical protein
MRSVLAYTIRVKGRGREALQNRVYKYARVLEYFHRDGVVSDAVPQRLKDGGGIDAIYMALCRNTRRVQKLGDGLEEPMAALPLARTANGTIDNETALSPASVTQGRLAASHSPTMAGDRPTKASADRFPCCPPRMIPPAL